MKPCLYALSAGEGFLVVEGEVGTGKTLLLRRCIEHLAGALAGGVRAESRAGPARAVCGDRN